MIQKLGSLLFFITMIVMAVLAMNSSNIIHIRFLLSLCVFSGIIAVKFFHDINHPYKQK